MQDARREILTQVADGTLTPAEAASRLEEVERVQPETPPAPPGSAPGTEITGVRISNSYGRIAVYGDSSVAQARVEGPHVARTENGVFVIETDQSGDGDFWFGRREGGHWWDGLRGPTITVWMNPRLEAWISADAGSVAIRNVTAPIHAEVQAGSLVVEGFTSPIDLAASAGSIRAQGSLKAGNSRIHCEMGSVRVALSADSAVRVGAMAQLGRVTLDGPNQKRGTAPRFVERVEAVFGAGTASLDIDSEMGSVTVSRL